MRKSPFRLILGVLLALALLALYRDRKADASERALAALRHGGRVSAPALVLGMDLDGKASGSVLRAAIERRGLGRKRRLAISMTLQGFGAGELASCHLLVRPAGDGGRPFSCLSRADSAAYVDIGEVRFEPSGVTRPVVLERARVDEWYAMSEAERLLSEADGSGGQVSSGGAKAPAPKVWFEEPRDAAGLEVRHRLPASSGASRRP